MNEVEITEVDLTQPEYTTLSTAQREIIKELMLTQAFEFNDTYNRAHIGKAVKDLMWILKDLGIINDFMVTCDETNNTPKVIDSNALVLDVRVKRTGKWDPGLRFTLTVRGIKVSEFY